MPKIYVSVGIRDDRKKFSIAAMALLKFAETAAGRRR